MHLAFAAIVTATLLPSSLFAGPGRWTTTGPPDRGIAALAVGGPSGGAVYAVAALERLFRSPDHGETWSLIHTVRSRQILADPSNPAALIVNVERRLGLGSGLIKTSDGGASWQGLSPLPTQIVSITAITAIAADPSNFSTLYVGAIWQGSPPLPVQQGGLFKSTDGGNTWMETTLRGVQINGIAVDPSNPSVVYATPSTVPAMTGVNGWGVVKSVDGGLTWSERLPQFRLSTPLSWVVVNPRNPSEVYTSDVFNYVHKSTNGAATFQRIRLDSTIGVVRSLVIHPDGGLYASTSRGGVVRSMNSGLDWAPFNCGLPHLTMTQMAMSQDGRFLHVGTLYGGVFSLETVSEGLALPCTEADVLCLATRGRFCIRIAWRTSDGRSGFGRPVPLTDDTGSFWFFEPSNLEVMIKVLDGTGINGKYWVFYGALSNVEYEITVTDNETGRVKTYTNPQGQVASVTDIEAF